jgi:hypothetical protein
MAGFELPAGCFSCLTGFTGFTGFSLFLTFRMKLRKGNPLCGKHGLVA